MARYIVLFIASLVTMTRIFAQSEDAIMYTPFFNQFHKLKQSVNPAYKNLNEESEVSFGLQLHPGAFSNFRNSYLSSYISLAKDTDKKQFSGFMIKNESEGKLLNRTYYYAQYLITIPISKSYTLGSGIQIGAASIIFQNTTITPGSSSFAPDANIGFSLNSENRTIAIGFNQIMKSTLLHPGQTSVLNRFVTVMVDQSTKFSEAWRGRAVLLYQSDSFNTMAFNTEFTFVNKVGAFIGWNNRKGLGIGGFIAEYGLEKTNLSLGLNYYTAVGLQNTISIDEFEIVGGVSF